MAIDRLKNIRVSGIVCCVPENIVDIGRFADSFDKKGLEKFKKTTGIQRKHCCELDHVITAGDLCYAAADKLLQELDIERSSIDAVIFISQTSDYRMPATACILQHRLGLNSKCLAYDINLGCSGYPYGLHVAGAYLQSGHLKRVLLLTGEAGAHIQPVDNILFGEAGSATLLEYDETQPELVFLLRTLGEGFRQIICPYGGQRHEMEVYAEARMRGEYPKKTVMDGAEVFNFSIREVPVLVNDYFKETGWDAERFDVVALHQANLMILKQIIKKSKLPKDKCPISLDIYGNTSSASVPLAICDYFNRIDTEKKDDDLKEIMVCGYGVGLSLAVTSFSIAGTKCFPVITTNEAFEDGIL